MEKPHLLHLITPGRQASPFDVNMAYDAGFDAVIPYTDVTLEQVAGLVQDMIFSRGPKGVRRTSMFIGGREIGMATDMMDVAKNAMVPPFAISVLADPSGAYTTAAALVACVDDQLGKQHNTSLKDKKVILLGGTGPVGLTAAVLASDRGAKVSVVSYTSLRRAQVASEGLNSRYQAQVSAAYVEGEQGLAAALESAQVILATAKAGVQVLSTSQIGLAPELLVAADLNAVPPAGIQGMGMADNGKPLSGGRGVGIGPLAVGNVKYNVQRALLQDMINTNEPLYLDFRDAYGKAVTLLAQPTAS